MLEDQKQEASEKVDGKAKTRKASSGSDDIFGIPNTEGVFTEEIQVASWTSVHLLSFGISYYPLLKSF